MNKNAAVMYRYVHRHYRGCPGDALQQLIVAHDVDAIVEHTARLLYHNDYINIPTTTADESLILDTISSYYIYKR